MADSKKDYDPVVAVIWLGFAIVVTILAGWAYIASH